MLHRLAIVLGSLMLPLVAHAAVVTTLPWNGSLSGSTDFVGNIQFGGNDAPKFFTSSGDLKEAKFTFFVSTEGSLSGLGVPQANVGGIVRMTFALNAGGTALDPFDLDMLFSMSFDEFGTGSSGFGRGASFSRTLTLLDDASALGLLEGNFGDTFELACATTTFVSQSSAQADFEVGNAFASCGASFVYTFDNLEDPDPIGVPEPGTLALFGLAMAGAALAARRRKTV